MSDIRIPIELEIKSYNCVSWCVPAEDILAQGEEDLCQVDGDASVVRHGRVVQSWTK